MARKIVPTEEAVVTPSVDEKSTGAYTATFVKNQVNEIIVFEDGDTYQFAKSKETINDPVLADKLRKVATKFGIFEA